MKTVNFEELTNIKRTLETKIAGKDDSIMKLTISGKDWSTFDPIKLRNVRHVAPFTFEADTSHWGSTVVFTLIGVEKDKVIVHATLSGNVLPNEGERSILRVSI